ncbi:MAG: divalent-cation tolerance protein CutA [Wenzhouxiangellaceae bacterium]|nr:divalent-cation tolerance protein CutA [Wenzhouxiangellaceae bacterium]
MTPDTLLLVQTTCSEKSEAIALGSSLVEARLAACASVGSTVESIYPWAGTVQQDKEIPLMLKTTAGAFARLRDHILARHAYDVPEILAWPIADGHAEYMNWVRQWIAAGEIDE